MTVRELILLLQLQDPDRVVIMASDAEGNSYSPLVEGSAQAWNEDYKEIGIEKLTPELVSSGFTDEDVMQDGVPAFVLYRQ